MKNMITCMILDDEQHSVELIQYYANKIPALQITGSFNDPLQAVQAMKTQNFDIVFVDQHMPNMTGTNFIEQHAGRAKFILTTAYTNIDITGLENEIAGYLVKPFPFAKFEAAVEKVIVDVAVK
jgi:two-component system, LytTR family, response regulator